MVITVLTISFVVTMEGRYLKSLETKKISRMNEKGLPNSIYRQNRQPENRHPKNMGLDTRTIDMDF